MAAYNVLKYIPESWRSRAAGPFPALTTHGSVIGANVSGEPTALVSGTHGYALVADSGSLSGLGWAAFAGSNFYLDGLSFGTDSKITGSMTGVGDVTSNALTNFTPATTFVAKTSFTTGIGIGGNTTAAGYIELYEDSDDGDNFIKLQAGAMGGDTTYTLPTGYPSSSGYALVSTTAGVMSWATNTDANYYTSSVAMGTDGILTGTVAGGGSNWTSTAFNVITVAQIAFGQATSGLTTGSANLIWDATGLAVGTTAAAYKLDVVGTTQLSGAATFTSTLGVSGNLTVSGTSSFLNNTTCGITSLATK